MALSCVDGLGSPAADAQTEITIHLWVNHVIRQLNTPEHSSRFVDVLARRGLHPGGPDSLRTPWPFGLLVSMAVAKCADTRSAVN